MFTNFGIIFDALIIDSTHQLKYWAILIQNRTEWSSWERVPKQWSIFLNDNKRWKFLNNFNCFQALKAQINLNTKKLYMSDGHAVQELLKVAKLLYEASKESDPDNSEEVDPTDSFLADNGITAKVW